MQEHEIFHIMVIVGLGNPGKEYEQTRHNAGRSAAMQFANQFDFPDFTLNKKVNALIAEGKVGKTKVLVALPETFMNKSGNAAAKLIRTKKENRELIIIHDDLDIPIGKLKISYRKNSGGHKGVESVMRAIKTKNFVRIRIGVCPKRKPDHKEQMKFIVGKWKPAEQALMKKVFKKVSDTLETLIIDSLERAMSEHNQ